MIIYIYIYIYFQVILSHPSGQQKKHVEGEVANVIKYLSLGLFGTACKTMMHTPELSNSIKELLIKEVDNELEELCKKQKNSILRQTKAKDLVAFKTAKFIQEPTKFYKVFVAQTTRRELQGPQQLTQMSRQPLQPPSSVKGALRCRLLLIGQAWFSAILVQEAWYVYDVETVWHLHCSIGHLHNGVI